jgi:predicted ATPase
VNFVLVQEFWKMVYEHSKELLASIEFSEDGKAKIKVTDPTKKPREFLSSGEYQTLSLGLVFGALQPKHSIIMLDEPDLHLSLPAGVRMYNEVFMRSMLHDLQVIAVSHLPFVFPRRLHEESDIGDVARFFEFHKQYPWFALYELMLNTCRALAGSSFLVT